MQLFYTTEVSENTAVLDKNDSGHLIRVLRKKTGSVINFTNGKGSLYSGVIEDPDLKKCRISITEKISEFEKRDFFLHMAVAPTKNISRFECFVEKATELGIDVITPLICKQSERTTVKHERLERIAIAAMKQSLKTYLPRINPAVSFSDLLKNSTEDEKFIAWLNPDVNRQIDDLYQPAKSCMVIIGPEGDFTDEEVNQAKQKHFKPISLGKSRLRTETAAIAACHLVNFINSKHIQKP